MRVVHTRSCDASARAAAASVATARGGGDSHDQARAEIRTAAGSVAVMMNFFRLFHMIEDVQTLMSSGRGNFIASSASIVAPEVATALKKEREEKAASASVVSIQDVEDTDDKETKAELARLRAEHNAQIATDAKQAVTQRLEFIRRHTDLLLHFSSKAPTAASKSGFSGGRKGAGRMSEKEEV